MFVLLAGCGSGTGDGDRATATPTPQAGPSVWVSDGPQDAVATATGHLIRGSDLPPGFAPSGLQQLTTDKGVKPARCAALMGPALGLVSGSRGSASTSFVSGDSSTAVAHTVGVYADATAAAAAVTRAESLGTACHAMSAYGTPLTVTSDPANIRKNPGVVITQRQPNGIESITVVGAGPAVAVVAVAGPLPGPDESVIEAVATAAVDRLLGTATP